MTPWLLFRTHDDHEEEIEAARRVWGARFVRFRSQIPPGSLVVGRYSVLPHYGELAEEVELMESRLLNSAAEHAFVANMRRWYPVLKAWTPRTWFDRGWANAPECPSGYVVKGGTNSRKFEWSRRMYAANRTALGAVMRSLREDALLGEQGLVLREFVPLAPVLDEAGEPELGINGLPFSQEWRFFFVGEELIAAGFYWSIAERAVDHQDIPAEATSLAQRAAAVLAKHVTFYSLDVARTESGGWVVIEINEGAMSGLSMIDPLVFHQRLKKALTSTPGASSS